MVLVGLPSRTLRRGPRWLEALADLGLWSALAARRVQQRVRHRARKMDTQTTSAATPPTERQPDIGVVGVGDVVLSAAEHFISDDAVHTIRSTEFDVSAHADSFNDAVAMFVDNAENYCAYLAGLATEQKATPYELEALGRLVPRIIETRRERERESNDMVTHLLSLLGRKSPVPTWRQQTAPANSNQPSSG